MDSPITIFVSEYSIYPAMLGFMLAIAIVLVGIIVGISRRRKIEAYGIPAIGLILAGIIGTVSFLGLTSSTEAHERAQIDSIDSQLSQEFGLPIHIFGEDIIGFVRTPSGFGEAPGAQLRLSYRLDDGEVYWRAIDVKRTEPKDGRYGFEVLAVGEPKPIEDFIADMERPLTPEGLVPAEDDR